MLAAIYDERDNAVKTYLDAGGVPIPLTWAMRLLDVAAYRGSITIPRLTLEWGADPNLPHRISR